MKTWLMSFFLLCVASWANVSLAAKAPDSGYLKPGAAVRLKAEMPDVVHVGETVTVRLRFIPERAEGNLNVVVQLQGAALALEGTSDEPLYVDFDLAADDPVLELEVSGVRDGEAYLSFYVEHQGLSRAFTEHLRVGTGKAAEARSLKTAAEPGVKSLPAQERVQQK